MNDFFRKVLAEFFENLLLFRKFGSFEKFRDNIQKSLQKRRQNHVRTVSISWVNTSPLDPQWGQMGVGFSGGCLYWPKVVVSPRTLR